MEGKKDTRRYTAAGAVIVEPGGERVLLLLRPGRPGPKGQPEMRLPKGHVEPGESHRQAALREVHEEAGRLDVEVLADLGYQTVEFDWQDVHHVRQEHYYLMLAQNSASDAQPEKQFEPLWLSWEKALDEVTFDAERQWIRRARSAWERRVERA